MSARATDAQPVARAILPDMRRLAWLVVLLLGLASTDARTVAAAADAAPAGLQPGGSAVAVEIVDGDTLVLDTGQQVRLVGLQAPKLPLGRRGFRTWPLADAAKDALAELALGKRLALSYGGARVDRHGRLLAHLHDAAGRWVQGEMLARGMARVYTFADNRALAEKMLAIERMARAARRGVWAHPFYRIRSPAEAAGDIGSFQIVEGRVADAAAVRGRVYLNFGADWRTDFTVSIAPRTLKLFEAAGRDPLSLQGRTVRVRGWIESYNGPSIEASHPEQIERLD